jgi:hypothetical protein
VFFHTPKLELHISLNVQYRNTLPEVRKHQGVKKARASPKLKHQNTYQQNQQQYFLIETNIKRLIAVRKKKLNDKK